MGNLLHRKEKRINGDMRPIFQGRVKNGSRGRSPFYECRQWGECIFFLFLFSQGQWSTNKLARTGGRCENGL